MCKKSCESCIVLLYLGCNLTVFRKSNERPRRPSTHPQHETLPLIMSLHTGVHTPYSSNEEQNTLCVPRTIIVSGSILNEMSFSCWGKNPDEMKFSWTAEGKPASPPLQPACVILKENQTHSASTAPPCSTTGANRNCSQIDWWQGPLK